jgi:hypothetical protein
MILNYYQQSHTDVFPGSINAQQIADIPEELTAVLLEYAPT